MNTILRRFLALKTIGFCKCRYSDIPPPKRMSRMVWIDLEMTGLDINKDRIMEIACILTDNSLNIIAEGPNPVINQPIELLNSMNEWCQKSHTKTGLLEACKQSTVTEHEAEQMIISFLRQHNVKERDCPLAGNSVYVDRIFLNKYMQTLNEFLHYRIIDVSICKELCKRWNPALFSKVPNKKLVHRGLDDIRESIEELKYYKNFMFPQK